MCSAHLQGSRLAVCPALCSLGLSFGQPIFFRPKACTNNTKLSYHLQAGGNQYSPQQIGAFVLSKMKETAGVNVG